MSRLKEDFLLAYTIMRKNYGYRYFTQKRKQSFLKKLSLVNSLLLIVQITLGGVFYISPVAQTRADNPDLCTKPVDIVLIMDRSGSMDYTSRCDWWQLKCVNPPSCSSGYTWVKNTSYNESQAWCDARTQSAPHQSVFLSINPKKITAAKSAADNFLNLMGINDQSALVSYANTASLDKGLSTGHPATVAAVDGLTAFGATNIGDAIKLGVQELKSVRANAQANHVMILLTDGLANMPNGPGYGEFPADVAYAENQASLAAASGFKIFTIGLGNDGEINETMLQNIAAATGAAYYHAPTQNDLEAIYDSISGQVCQYGSISGCKYSDINKDGLITGEEKLSGWEIRLNNSENFSQLTDAAGCYQFSGLLPGSYTISEGGKPGVASEQTYPAGNSYAINLADGENLIDKDFGNYLPVCGNSMLDTGYAGYSETCEIGDSQPCTAASGYSGNQSCSLNCLGWDTCVSSESCGDGIVNNGEQCDGASGVGPHQTCSATCTIINQPYCGDGIVNDGEQCDNSAPRSCTTPSGYSGSQACAAGCIWAIDCLSAENCGDGIQNGAEICDDGINNGGYGYCSNDCTGQTPSVCSNGVREGTEQCDGADGVDAHQSCSDTCTLINIPYCGDNLMNQPSEQCDGTAGVGAHQSCSGTCTIINLPYCGDNLINQASEQCDGTTGVGAHQACSGACTLSDLPYCGDGIKNNSEQCDGTDGVGAHQACSGTCVLSDLPYCGDHIVNGGDVCDGNSQACTAGGYSGSKSCLTDCSGWSDACQTSEYCGDGIINSAEECEGAGTNICTTIGGYFGTQACGGCVWGACSTTQSCGDGVKNGYEQCDGADGVGAHQACSSTLCTLTDLPYCGDGSCNNSETCSSCTADCGGCGGGGTNNPPVATDVATTTEQNTALTIFLTATDADGDTLAFATTSDPLHGTLGLISGNTVIYTPNADYTGSDTFNFIVNDGSVNSNTAAVTITINSPTVTDVCPNLVGDQTTVPGGYHLDNGQCLADSSGGGGGSGGNGGGGGSGSSASSGLTLINLNSSSNLCSTVLVSWLTSEFADSRVIYDTASHPDITGQSSPNFGYAYSTLLDATPITGHSVAITGLTPGATYYLRPISTAGTAEKVGAEISIIVNANCGTSGAVLGEKISDAGETVPVSIPGAVLGEKISDAGKTVSAPVPEKKVLGIKILPATGFSPAEFIFLLISLTLTLATRLLIKRSAPAKRKI